MGILAHHCFILPSTPATSRSIWSAPLSINGGCYPPPCGVAVGAPWDNAHKGLGPGVVKVFNKCWLLFTWEILQILTNKGQSVPCSAQGSEMRGSHRLGQVQQGASGRPPLVLVFGTGDLQGALLHKLSLGLSKERPGALFWTFRKLQQRHEKPLLCWVPLVSHGAKSLQYVSFAFKSCFTAFHSLVAWDFTESGLWRWEIRVLRHQSGKVLLFRAQPPRALRPWCSWTPGSSALLAPMVAQD